MAIGEYCVRNVAFTSRATTVEEAARLMRKRHVGNLVIVEGSNGNRKPVGIVTDRDIVISVVATKLDPKVFTVGDLLVERLVTAREDQGVFECIRKMREKGVRRMPVVDAAGELAGIVSVDDMIKLLGEEMNQLSKLIARERLTESRKKR